MAMRRIVHPSVDDRKAVGLEAGTRWLFEPREVAACRGPP